MNPRYALSYDKDILNEIAVGLVLHLDPDALEREGGKYTCAPDFRVQGQHFFLCVAVNGGMSRWLPLYTNLREGRQLLDQKAKKGHPKWLQGQHCWYGAQVWEASAKAIYLAAARGHDKTRKGNRNTIAPEGVPGIDVVAWHWHDKSRMDSSNAFAPVRAPCVNRLLLQADHKLRFSPSSELQP